MRGYLLQPGVMDYAEAWDLQRQLAAARAAGIVPDTLMLLEHPHTYTLGRSGKKEHLLLGEDERAARGVAVFDVDRGGDITYHGPGQLVGYPILDLGRPEPDGHLPQVDYVGYLRRIEEVLIRALVAWDITAFPFEGYTGVWVDAGQPAKIAAIGVKVDGQGISQHGFALNVDPELIFFEGIVPCGIHDRGITSITRLLGQHVTVEDALRAVAGEFGREFGLVWERISLAEVESELARSKKPHLECTD